MSRKIALISDFDGTITGDDFFNYLSRAFWDEASLEPWRCYLNGDLSHFEALNEMFQKVHIPENELQNFMNQIQIDPAFIETVELCNEKKIPLYICSAGCDYYINYLIGNLIKKYDITLVTNSGTYSPETGLVMEMPPLDSPYYDAQIGISKASIVNKLHREDYEVVYAGDGPPDYEAAWLSDVVFAKKFLLEKCRASGIPTRDFRDFNDVNSFLREI